MAKLSLMFENKLVKEVPIGSRPVTIGRSPDNDLPVDNLAVSNYHARVYFEGGRLVVEDLDSLNGTFVNDLRVERATSARRRFNLGGKTPHQGGRNRRRRDSLGHPDARPPRQKSMKRWCWTRKYAAK